VIYNEEMMKLSLVLSSQTQHTKETYILHPKESTKHIRNMCETHYKVANCSWRYEPCWKLVGYISTLATSINSVQV